MANFVDVYFRAGFEPQIRDGFAGFGKILWFVAQWDGDHNKIPKTPQPPDGQGELLVSCHWPRLFPDEMIARYPIGAINLHPNLSLGYKVEDPVGQALKDGKTMMSVACHRMTNDPDSGEILAEHWRTIPQGSTVEYAYQLLKPLYVSVLKETLGKLWPSK